MRIVVKDLTNERFDGVYSPCDDTITICKSLKGKYRHQVLLHEIGHRIFYARCPNLSNMFNCNSQTVSGQRFWKGSIMFCILGMAVFIATKNLFLYFFLILIPAVMLLTFIIYELIIIDNLWRFTDDFA